MWIQEAAVPGAGVAAVATKVALGVQFKDGVEMISVTGFATAATKAGGLAVGFCGTFSAGVKILADIAHFVGTWADWLLGLA